MKVSVVTPSLNGMAYLPQCIASVREQESLRVEIEHILVDGGSTDGTPVYAEENGCIVLTREEENPTYAMNKGFRRASGTLVSVLACDDVLLPGGVDAIVRRYQADGRRWLSGAGRWIDAGDRSFGVQKAPPPWIARRPLATLGWSPFVAPATFYERSLLEELGYYDVDYYYAADYEFCLKALSRAPFSQVTREVAGVRRHEGNLSKERNPRHERELREIADEYGPSSRSVHAASRLGLKVFMNARNPGWATRKRLDVRRRELA
jgi:glycosyltransferase involved in cell wall biosynthesis